MEKKLKLALKAAQEAKTDVMCYYQQTLPSL